MPLLCYTYDAHTHTHTHTLSLAIFLSPRQRQCRHIWCRWISISVFDISTHAFVVLYIQRTHTQHTHTHSLALALSLSPRQRKCRYNRCRWISNSVLESCVDLLLCWSTTSNPTWGDIFETQSSKLKRLFSLKRGKRDFRLWALSFETAFENVTNKTKQHTPQVGLAVYYPSLVLINRVLIYYCVDLLYYPSLVLISRVFIYYCADLLYYPSLVLISRVFIYYCVDLLYYPSLVLISRVFIYYCADLLYYPSLVLIYYCADLLYYPSLVLISRVFIYYSRSTHDSKDLSTQDWVAGHFSQRSH